MNRSFGVAVVVLGLAGCLGANDDPSTTANALLRRASRLFDGRTYEEVAWEASLDRLAQADVVFLGETHLDQLTHDAELEILRGLVARRGGAVTLSMEMFERDAQPALDDYLAGKVDEKAFLARSRPWQNFVPDYRPLVELAKREGLPVIAANIPAPQRGKLARGGQAALDAMPPAERALVPETLIESPPEYWDRVENVTRSHSMLGGGAPATAPVAGAHLFDGQNLWDNAMAESIARELARRPGRLVVHVCGGFHSDRWQGTVWQLLQRRADASVRTVAIQMTSDLAGTYVDDAEPRADLIVRVEARARSEQDGAAAVLLAHEHRYRLRAPPHAAAPLPVLVWLCESGQSAEDAIALWEPVVGKECALVAIEPNFPELADEGVVRGRWWFPGDAESGGALAAAAVERALDVLTRDQPGGDAPALPIDRTRVVVAGERAGAAMVFCAARSCDRTPFTALAFAPTARDELAMMALPVPPDRGRVARRLEVFDGVDLAGEWHEITARDREIRLETPIVSFPEDPAERESAQIDVTRARLGLDPLAPSRGADELLRSAPEERRARFFTRVQARRARAAGAEAPPSLAVTAAAFADGAKLPLSSGAFGGTTIVVVPESAGPDELAAWEKLQDPDVIQKRSRFHRLRVAHGTGERSPKAVIEKLRAENPQRRDFLLVPAEFCVDDAAVRALRAGLGPFADELRLEILRGLGDRL
jgi:uncharacterized iron-regulated protein